MKQDNQQRTASPTSASARPIRIVGFVDGDLIPPACYDEPYCLQPSKDDSKAYDVLREVMHRTHKVGLAAVMIEKKQALAAIVPIGRTLVLNVLRLATSLVPGGKRTQEARAPSQPAPVAKPRARGPHLAAVRPRNAQSAAATTSRPAARIAASRRSGEVIDLALRRSTKRATQPRTTKAPRGRSGTVATLHHLRRKSPVHRAPVEIQLA